MFNVIRRVWNWLFSRRRPRPRPTEYPVLRGNRRVAACQHLLSIDNVRIDPTVNVRTVDKYDIAGLMEEIRLAGEQLCQDTFAPYHAVAVRSIKRLNTR